jgi:sugar phosphate isomerase/epimerase
VKLSCNLYSFNAPLVSGEMSLDEVLQLCSDLGFAAVDPTAYYLRGYPSVPADEYLYGLKRQAFLLGLDISGTGVRNDFTLAEPDRLRAEVELVRSWVAAAAKLDAPVLRVFAGPHIPDNEARTAAREGVVEAFRECARYGAEHGVMLVLQNHWDFVRTAEQTLDLVRAVDSQWFGLMVDIGSFRTGDPYVEIAQTAASAATWQIKETVFRAEREEKTDLDRLMRIVRESGYRGYLPIETLGPGDPREKVPRFLTEMRGALERAGLAA